MGSALRGHIHFVLAASVLAGSGGFLKYGKEHGLLLIIKKPLPLRKPLDDLDQRCLLPWQLVSAGKLPAEAEEELGTKDYLNWIVSDPSGGPERKRQVSLTVTYYTGVQDQVPHVPEECVYQGGMTQAEAKKIYQWVLPRLGRKGEAARVIFDSPRQMGKRLFVYYTIAVNGELRGDRNSARYQMADPRDSHLYYSKVEVSIFNTPDADLSELDDIGRDLLDRALAELTRSHWPLKGWERGGPPADLKRAA